MIHERVFPRSPDDAIASVSGSAELPALWSEAFCYACILIVLSAGIVRRLEGLGTNANSFSGTLRICMIMAA